MNWLSKANLIACACALAASGARAHPMSVVHGTLTIAARSATVEIVAFTDDIEHAGIDAESDGALGQYAHALAASLVMFDARGERLGVRDVRAAQPEGDAGGVCALVFESAAEIEAITLRLDPGAPAFIGGGQMQLRHAGGARALRLTTGGNVETVRADGDPEIGPGMRDVRVVVRSAPSGMVIDVYAPLALADSWAPAARERVDALTPAEGVRAAKAIAARLAPGVTLTIDGAETRAAVDRAVILGPLEGRIDDASDADQRCCWSARVGVRLSAPAPKQSVALRWGLFSAAVPRVFVAIEGASVERALSATAASIEWEVSAGAEAPH